MYIRKTIVTVLIIIVGNFAASWTPEDHFQSSSNINIPHLEESKDGDFIITLKNSNIIPIKITKKIKNEKPKLYNKNIKKHLNVCFPGIAKIAAVCPFKNEFINSQETLSWDDHLENIGVPETLCMRQKTSTGSFLRYIKEIQQPNQKMQTLEKIILENNNESPKLKMRLKYGMGYKKASDMEKQRNCLTGFAVAIYYANLIYADITKYKQVKSPDQKNILKEIILDSNNNMLTALACSFQICQSAFSELHLSLQDKSSDNLTAMLEKMAINIYLIMEAGTNQDNIFLSGESRNKKMKKDVFTELFPAPFESDQLILSFL